MNSNIVPNSFIAISDFHSYRYPLEKVKDYYLNEYEKIFILGDVTDRGKDNKGTDGIGILEEIMNLSKKYPERVIYIPGNHDELLYNYARNKEYFYKVNIIHNGGENTVKEINQMLQNDHNRADRLIDWLGKQPLQREHYYNGQRYVFAHAFFNQKIYEQNSSYALKDLYHHKFRSQSYNKPGNILWYRKGRTSNFEEISIDEVPTNAIMVIGHTPERSRKGIDLSLENKEGNITPVYCVDGGIAKGDSMIKYDGGKNCLKTQTHYHNDTSISNESLENKRQEALEIMCEAAIETASKHDESQVYYAFSQLIYGDEDWPMYFSRDNRDRLCDLDEGIIKSVLFSLSGEKVDPIAGIDKFLDNLFNDKEDQKKAKNYNDTIVQIIDEDKTPIYSENIDNTQKIHLSNDEFDVINNKNQLYTYGLTKDEIIQDDLKLPNISKKVTSSNIIKNSEVKSCPYGLTKDEIIQDDLKPKIYTKKQKDVNY